MINREFLNELVNLFDENLFIENWNPKNTNGYLVGLEIFFEILGDTGILSNRMSEFVTRSYILENSDKINKAIFQFKAQCKIFLDNPQLYHMRFEEFTQAVEFIKLREAARELFVAIMIVESRENDHLIFYKEDN
jgi:hypothetical protein